MRHDSFWLLTTLGLLLAAVVAIRVTPAPVAVVVSAIAAILAVRMIWAAPSDVRERTLRSLRTELVIGSVAVAGMLLLSFGPEIPNALARPLTIAVMIAIMTCLAMIAIRAVVVLRRASAAANDRAAG